jgi:hypothetical protein
MTLAYGVISKCSDYRTDDSLIVEGKVRSESALVVVGHEHRLADPDSSKKMLAAVETAGTEARKATLKAEPKSQDNSARYGRPVRSTFTTIPHC